MDKTPEQNVEQVDELVKQIYTQLDNPEYLSRSVLALSVLYAGLGNYLVEARDQERVLDVAYKVEFGRVKLKYVKEGDSATIAESRARLDLVGFAENILAANKRVDILKLKREDVDKLIDAARSRLSLIKGDMQRQ